jgi:hypothetical protein
MGLQISAFRQQPGGRWCPARSPFPDLRRPCTRRGRGAARELQVAAQAEAARAGARERMATAGEVAEAILSA